MEITFTHGDGPPPVWTDVDRYIEEHLAPPDPALARALEASAAAGLPAHEVSPAQGRLLQCLALACGARSILEVGVLGGYSTVWLARALPPGGRLVAVERRPAYARVARENLAGCGIEAAVEVRVGDSREVLAALAAESAGPFDFVFLDGDKAALPEDFAAALALSRPGTVLVADNVVRGGAVADGRDDDPRVRGVRRFYEAVAAEPRVTASAVQTVGAKGHDGFALAVVTR